MSQPTPAIVARHRNSALWAGIVLLVLSLLVNAFPSLYALKVPGVRMLPWVALLLPVLSLLCFVVGLRRAFGMRQVYGGRIYGSIFGVLSLLVLLGSTFLFVHVRAVPASAGAPKVGQKAPDFTLADTEGKPVSLVELLTPPSGEPAPRALLLVFYRGYW